MKPEVVKAFGAAHDARFALAGDFTAHEMIDWGHLVVFYIEASVAVAVMVAAAMMINGMPPIEVKVVNEL